MQMTHDVSALITENTSIVLAPERPRTRVWELDFLRGVCIILMMLDHLAMLIAFVFGPAWFGRYLVGDSATAEFCRWCDWFFFDSEARQVLHPLVVSVFFIISGISCTFSRSNFRRGGILAALAIVYSLVTYALAEFLSMPDIIVNFGVLHFYAVCILAYASIDLICRRSELARSAVCVAVVLVVIFVYFFYTPPADTPTWLGIVFPPEDFRGNPSLFYDQADLSPGDLFSLIPNAASFFAGTVLGPLLYARRCSLFPFLDGKWNIPFNFVGKHSLWFFILHLPVLALALAVVSALFVSPGNWVLF